MKTLILSAALIASLTGNFIQNLDKEALDDQLQQEQGLRDESDSLIKAVQIDFDAKSGNVRYYKALDGQHLTVSCKDGADPTIKGAEQYNTIVVSCIYESKQ
jgi:hypothetical protein